jgi:hypothetical protein
MATVVKKLQNFLRSPQGKKVVDTGKRELKKPENQARVKKAFSRLTGKRR